MAPEISSTTDRICHHFAPFFALFAPQQPRKSKFLKKKKKTPGGIIILNMNTINENHMMYDS